MSEEEKEVSWNSPAESNQSSAKFDDNLSFVLASESELIGDDTKSLKFGKIVMNDNELAWMVTNWMIERACVCLPKNETIPDPKPHECVVFWD